MYNRDPQIDNWKNGKKMETKILPCEFKLVEGDESAKGRTVEGYAAAFGNIDGVGDIIHKGAFKNTIVSRGPKIKFLWQHDQNEPIGKIVEMHEDDRGLFFKALISDTARGRDALALLNDKAIDSLSIGYDAMPGETDYTKQDGQTIRNLRSIRLWEISMVTFPANEEAVITGLKRAAPSEVKPWAVFHEGDKWRVYKIDGDGKPMGEALGEHATEDDARQQVEALFASEGKAGKAKWTTAYINTLPDSAFLYIASGGEKDEEGKTTPRNLRYFPYRDAEGAVDLPHLRNAIARIPQSDAPGLDDAQKTALQERAQALLEKENAKSAKAVSFTEALASNQREQALDERRWQLEGALREALYSIVRDPALDSAAKVEAFRQSLTQYADAMAVWFTEALAANYWDDVNQGVIGKSAKAGRRLKGDMMSMLDEMDRLMQQMRAWANYQDEEPSAPAEGQAAKTAAAPQAGPSSQTPTSTDLLRLIEIENEELSLMEV